MVINRIIAHTLHLWLEPLYLKGDSELHVSCWDTYEEEIEKANGEYVVEMRVWCAERI